MFSSRMKRALKNKSSRYHRRSDTSDARATESLGWNVHDIGATSSYRDPPCSALTSVVRTMVGVDEDGGKDVGGDATPCSANAPMSEVGVGSQASVGVASGATPCSADTLGVGVGSAGDIGTPSGVGRCSRHGGKGRKDSGSTNGWFGSLGL
jgi:hypothetical protein